MGQGTGSMIIRKYTKDRRSLERRQYKTGLHLQTGASETPGTTFWDLCRRIKSRLFAMQHYFAGETSEDNKSLAFWKLRNSNFSSSAKFTTKA
uniref:Uncharacterized protein n=1 Tax=Romanomermis culicivorax TaxID=13658 RepID=A0A915KX78_ROMCU